MINLITIKIDCEMDETTLNETIFENKKYYDIKTIGFKDYVLFTGTKDNLSKLISYYITDNPSEIKNLLMNHKLKFMDKQKCL